MGATICAMILMGVMICTMILMGAMMGAMICAMILMGAMNDLRRTRLTCQNIFSKICSKMFRVCSTAGIVLGMQCPLESLHLTVMET